MIPNNLDNYVFFLHTRGLEEVSHSCLLKKTISKNFGNFTKKIFIGLSLFNSLILNTFCDFFESIILSFQLHQEISERSSKLSSREF